LDTRKAGKSPFQYDRRMDCVLAPMTKAISFTDNNVRFIRALYCAAQNGAD